MLSAGAVYVFRAMSYNTWSQVAKLTASNAGNNFNFGKALSLDNNFIIAGMIGDDQLGTMSGVLISAYYIIHIYSINK